MKMLDDLETRVLALVSQITDLKNENKRLREENELKLQSMAEENTRLKTALDEEAAARQEVLGRIDSLLQLLDDQAKE